MPSVDAYKYLPPELAERLHRLDIRVRRPVQGSVEGMHRSPHFGSSVEFAEYREYSPGDPVNRIDWSVYARSDRYMIRRFHEETNLRAHLLLDVSASLDFRDEGRMTKMDCACYLAAGLMYILVRQGDSVGLATFNDRVREHFEPTGTFEGLRPLLLHLQRLRPAGRSRIEAALHQAAAGIRSRSLVIVISDLLEEPEGILRGIRHLHHDGHNIMVLHVLDRGERRLSFGGIAELRELETGARLLIEVDEIREAYRHAVEQYLNKLRAACAECQADYRLMDTLAPLEESLSRLQRRAPA